jgi:hypothetical protein
MWLATAMIKLLLAGVAIVAAMRVWWESAGTAIAAATNDAELMEKSASGMNAAMAVALVAFVLLALALAGGAL